MKQAWKKYLLYGSVVAVLGILAYILMETVRAKNTGFETKTLWDWMDLLLIPVFLAGGAYFLNRSEKDRERETADNRIREDRRLAEDRAKLEREIAHDHQLEAALQTYLDRMTELLLKEDLQTTHDSKVQNIAAVRTHSVLDWFDPRRKGIVVRFLRASNLIQLKPKIDLYRANLAGAHLHSAYLEKINLRGVTLSGADLRGANLSEADLSQAKLNGADLMNANLVGANLEASNLQGTNLEQANLKGAKVTNEQLAVVKSLKGATMPDGTKHD